MTIVNDACAYVNRHRKMRTLAILFYALSHAEVCKSVILCLLLCIGFINDHFTAFEGTEIQMLKFQTHAAILVLLLNPKALLTACIYKSR